MKTENTLTWFQFNNIFPIVTSAVLIAFSFAALRTDIEVVKQNQTNQLAILQEIKEQQLRLITDLNSLHTSDSAMALDIARLKDIANIK